MKYKTCVKCKYADDGIETCPICGGVVFDIVCLYTFDINCQLNGDTNEVLYFTVEAESKEEAIQKVAHYGTIVKITEVK